MLLFCLLCVAVIPIVLIGTACAAMRYRDDDFTHED